MERTETLNTFLLLKRFHERKQSSHPHNVETESIALKKKTSRWFLIIKCEATLMVLSISVRVHELICL